MSTMLKSILVVCVGNICRSPLAEGLFKSRFQARQDKDIPEVVSAGIHALTGHPPDPVTIRIAERLGIDIRTHRARQLTDRLLDWAELVLVMEDWHREEIFTLSPASRGKTYTLGYWDREQILDPYRRPVDIYINTARQIRSSVQHWSEKLC